MSGAVFGGLGAAATSWISMRAYPRNGGKLGVGHAWVTAAGGLFSGAVAFHSIMRPAEGTSTQPAMQVNAALHDGLALPELQFEQAR